MIPALVVEGLVKLIELAAEVAPSLVDIIKTHGELTDAQKADLLRRYDVARARAALYEPKGV